MSEPGRRRPSLSERARPAEVLGLSAVLAAFVGGAVLFASREPLLAVVFAGVAFIVSVVVCATLLLAISKPEPPEDGPTGH
jgi:zinc transporter ZupT